MSNKDVLRFSLCVYREKQDAILRELHFFAREQMFRGVSSIMSFSGDDCKILPGDDMAIMKHHSQGLALANGRLLSFLPESFSAFACQLPNKRLMFLGFANYPQIIQSPGGKQFITPWEGKGIWYSNVFTSDSRFIDKKEDNYESHRIACNILRYAKDLNVLESVEDSTGYFANPKNMDMQFKKPLKFNNC